jgi:PadR family transcriptional regulator AphA
MNTRTLCLGVLSLGKASGYDIGKKMDEIFSHFVDIAHSSVYPALRGLDEEGLVKCEVVEQDSLPNKKIYELTDAGRKRLVEELAVLQPTFKVRSQFMLLMFFAEFLPTERLEQIFNERLNELNCFFGEAADIRKQMCDTSGKQFLLDFVEAKLRAEKEFLESKSGEFLEQLSPSAEILLGEVS